MKNLYTLLFLLLISQGSFSQVLEVTHQSNGTVLQLPIESIDSVRVNEYSNYLLKTVYQNNGNILGIALQDVDSISYVIPDISSLPTLNTLAISQETSNAVFSGGIVLSDGGSPVTQRGVCWNTTANPTLANSFTIDGAGTGNYTSHAIPLNAATSYFLRSYATNENGTAYGNQLTFTTASSNQNADLPEVVTGELVYDDGLVALGAGTVTIPSGTVSAKGLCWAIGATPTINSSHSVEGAGTGDFTSSIVNLQHNTLYRVRAYATSDAGITYGDEVLFRTNDFPQYYSTSVYNYLEDGAVSLTMAVDFDGGSEITERGVCWSTEGPPTIDDDFSAIGSGEGTFYKNFTNLDPANVYYFRPYATNGIGTSYGNVVSVSLETSLSLEDIYAILYRDPAYSSSHTHFGQKSIDIFSDMLSSDLALSQSTYGWYRTSITEFSATVGPSTDAQYIYDYYMEIIDTVNPLIISLTPFGSLPSNDQDRWLLGQVKALRGYAYFYLTQLLQEKYNPDEVILPLHVGSYDNTPVATSTIYNQILNDLNSSIILLDNYTSPDKLHVNKTIAQGLLAYTHAAMGNYAAAKPLADAVIASEYPLTTASELVHPGDDSPGGVSGFNDVNTPSWMWGVDLNEDIGLGLISWWGQMDYYSYSYAAYGDFKAIDASLFAEIPTDDLRKGQFIDDTSLSQHLMPLYKFYDSDRTHTGTATIVKADYLFMRVDEFYLLSAECATRLGNDAEARATMIPFLDIRIPNAETIVNALSGAELQDFIYLQTKIELWGEGKTYLAMKRNQATITRGTNHLSFVGESFSYDADELTFDMVSLESNYSPPVLEFLNCGGLVQNGDVLVFQESVTDFTFQIPYVTQGGGDYEAIDFYSSGVQGLTASIADGTFNEFEGMLEFTITGTPLDYGTATFNVTIGGRSCVISFEVVAVENCTAYPTILTINFDENPEQTYWKLFSASDSSTPLFSGGLDGSYAGMTSIQIPFCLEDGAYVLTFFDTNNDGMNSGGYSLNDIYGNKYACGGTFTEPEVTQFTAGVDSALNEFEIQLGFDSWPEEVYWALVDVDTEEIVMTSSTTSAYGAYAGMAGGLIVKNCNLPSGNYNFQIYDGYGDGGTSVVLRLNGNEIGSISASSYGSSTNFEFSI